MSNLVSKIGDALAGKPYSWDVYIEEKTSLEAKVNSGEVDSLKNTSSTGAAIRVFKDGKMGFAYLTSPEQAESAVQKAEATALSEGYGDYKPGNAKAGKIDLSDPEFGSIDMDRVKEAAFELESTIGSYGSGVKYSRDATASAGKNSVTYFNSSGASASFEKTISYCYATAIAGEGEAQEAVDGMASSASFSTLDFSTTAKQTAQRAAALVGGSSIKSGTYSLMLPPHTAVDLLSVLSQLFLGNNIRKGKSLLKECKKGEIIGPQVLEIRDDALLPMRPGSFPVDAEGYGGANKAVVINGALETFLFDALNGAGLSAASTGNSVRRGFKAMPEPGISNFYIPAGKTKKSVAIDSFTGIYADSLMGLHTANPVSGNFSLGAAGWLYEKGKIIRPVKETLIAGNIKDIMKNITAVGDDLEFYFNLGAPTVVIGNINAAGKDGADS